MVGKVPNLDPNVGSVRLRGQALVYFDSKRQKFVSRSWPQGNGGDTPARKLARQQFQKAVQLIKYAMPEDVIGATKITENSALLTRDALMLAAFGKLLTAIMPDGTVWQGIRLMDAQIQPALDSISSRPGAMMVRTTVGWQALIPDVAGTVLTSTGVNTPAAFTAPVVPAGAVQDVTGSDGVSAVRTGDDIAVALAPMAPATLLGNVTGAAAVPVSVSLSDALDLLGASDGDILFRGAGGWEVLTIGADGQLLSITGGIPVWSNGGGHGGVAGIYTMPVNVASSTSAAFATYGNVFQVFTDIDVDILTMRANATAGAVYKLGMYEIDNGGVPHIVSELTSGTFTVITTGDQMIAVPVARQTVLAGRRYAIMGTLTSSSTTTPPGMMFEGGDFEYPCLPQDLTVSSGYVVMASVNPVAGDSIGSIPTSGAVSLGFHAFI